MNIWANKPLLIGGAIVIGGIVLIVASGSKAEAGTTYMTVPNGQSDAQLAAARDIQIAQIQAGAAVSSANASLTAQQQQAQLDLQKTTLQAQLSQYAIDAENARSAHELNVNADIQRLQIQGQLESQEFLAGQQAAVARYTLDQALATTRSNNEFQLEYAENANNTSVLMQQIQAQVVNNQLAVNRDVTLGVLTSQQNLEIAKIAANRDIYLTDIQANADISSAALAYQAEADRLYAQQQQQQTAAVIGSLGSLKKKNRDDVLQALITGQPYGYQGPPGPSKTAQVIGAAGGAIGSIGKVIGGLF